MGQTALNLQGIDVLCVYGNSETEFHEVLFPWLKEDSSRFLVWVVEGEEAFFQLDSSLANDPQIRLFCDTRQESLYQRIAWEFVWMRLGYLCVEEASRTCAEVFFKQLEQFHRGVDLLASDFHDRGAQVLHNLLENLEKLPRAKRFESFAGKFAGVPAILCGAGPSLDASISELREIQDRALILAGGSSVRALNGQGIFPHLHANIDPDPPYRRFLEQEMYTQPFFYQDRFSSSLLERVAGPLVWMPASGSYPIEGWMAAECGIFTEPMESGWTVSNVLAKIAHHLGCDPIILVGMDFSCRKEAIYAGGIAGEENRAALIPVDAELYSKKDWLMSAEWMQTFTENHPETRWLNATEGGIELEGIERRSLKTFADWPVIFDLQGKIHQVFEETPLSGVSLETVDAVKKKVKNSFENSLEYCDQLLKLWEKHYPDSPIEKGEYALLDVELEGEVCYREFLLPLWNVWKWPLLRGVDHHLGREVHRLLFFKRVIDSTVWRQA